jgi:serine/threonine protein phosphatase PrpC
MEAAPRIEITAFTHRGRLRASNEDGITVAGWVAEAAMSQPRCSQHELTEPLLVALADGMGGHAGGEVASRYAIERLTRQPLDDEADIADALAAINVELYQTMATAPELLGMGTTVAGLLLTARRALWFNLGDSRVYRQRDDRLQQLSTDDVPPGRRSGVMTQTLGGAHSFAPVSPHIGAEDLVVPVRYLLCSDGLTDMLSPEQIERVLADAGGDSVRALFARAMAAGGSDNISIILVSVAGG